MLRNHACLHGANQMNLLAHNVFFTLNDRSDAVVVKPDRAEAIQLRIVQLP